jgi:O-glycosyl hydrolase
MIRAFVKVALSIVVLAVAAIPVVAAVEVKLDETREYQVIDGFGAFGGKVVPWSGDPYYDDAFLDLIIDDLGVTIIRDEVPCTFQLNPDSSDPSTLDLSKYTPGARGANSTQGSHRPLTDHLPYFKALMAKAAKSGEPLKIIASVWSPPYWMKYVNSIFGGDWTWNRLKAQPQNDSRDRFAQYCAAYVKYIKRETGVDIYAFSPQNEPVFAQGYQSCVYSPDQLADIVARVGKRFEKEGIASKIFMPEDVTVVDRIKGYISADLENPASRQYTSIIAVHGYANDGITRDNTGPKAWKETYDLVRKYNKPLWMTETSGYKNTWDDAMGLAQAIYSALKYGKLSAWVWWTLSERGGNDMVLMADGQPTPKYYASKHFYRYVRPGAIAIESTSSDDKVGVMAFKHLDQKTLTVVLLNVDGAEKDVRLGGARLPASFKAYRSTASEKCLDVGEVKDTVRLPGRSIVTLVAKGFQGTNYQAKAPAILEPPKDVEVAEGEVAEFSVVPQGCYPYPMKFQWQKGGRDIAGATFPTCILKGVKASDDGAAVTVTLTSTAGSVTSRAAQLKVPSFRGVTITRTDTVPALDGKLDATWEKAPAYKIANVLRGKVESEADLSGTFRAMWDKDNLYLLADITDNVKKTAADFESDAVELYFDGDNSKGGTYDDNDFQYLFVYRSSKVVEVKHVPPKGNTPIPQASIQDVTCATADTDKGYRIAARIPWKTLNTKPEEGHFVGFDVHVNDNDSGKRDKKIGWFAKADNVWEMPSRMGTAKLCGAAK